MNNFKQISGIFFFFLCSANASSTIIISSVSQGTCIGGNVAGLCTDNHAGIFFDSQTTVNNPFLSAHTEANSVNSNFFFDSNLQLITGGAESIVSANASNGEIKLFASSLGGLASGRSSASIGEMLLFDLGILEQALVTFNFHVEASYNVDAIGAGESISSLHADMFLKTGEGVSLGQPAFDVFLDGSGVIDQLITASFLLTPTFNEIDLTTTMSINANRNIGGAFINALNTGSVSIDMPDGVSFTSSSGFFLTGVAVPEPTTLALLGLGLIGLGFNKRNKVS